MPQSLTPHDLVYGLVGIGDPQIAPEGQSIAYIRSQASPGQPRPASRLWRINRDGSDATPISDETESASTPRWSPDGARLAWAARKDEDHAIAILTGSEIAKYPTPTAPGELSWSPDGGSIAFVRSYDPDNPGNTPVDPKASPKVRVVNRIDYKQENRGYLNDVRNCVFILDVASGTIRQLTDDRTDHLSPQWSPDCRKIATKISRTNTMTSQVIIIDVATGSQTKVGSEEGFISIWSFTPDGTALVYAGDTVQTWQQDWFRYDLASGQTTRLTDDFPLSVDGGFATVSLPAQPIWEDDARLLYHGSTRGQSAIGSFDTSSSAHEVVATWRAVNGGWSATRDAKTIVQIQTKPDHPGVLVAIDLITGNTETVLDPNTDGVFASPICQSERITINRLGYDMDGWLIRPTDHDGQQPLNLVLNIHGGPNGAHGPMFDAVSLAIVAAGYAVLTTNPRGSTSYGRAFTMAVTHDWAGEDYNDQLAFLDEVTGRPYLARTDLVSTATAMVATCPPGSSATPISSRRLSSVRRLSTWSRFTGRLISATTSDRSRSAALRGKTRTNTANAPRSPNCTTPPPPR